VRGNVTVFYVSYKQRTAHHCIHSSTQLTHDPHLEHITGACQPTKITCCAATEMVSLDLN
jgi:hypothetical protein